VKGLIIAAGRGSRLAARPQSKPLCPVGSRALIEWVILAARRAGIREFVVVTGYARENLERHLKAFARESGVSISFVPNDEWEKENGLSVYKARGLLGGTFVLLMADHIIDAGILTRLVAEPLQPGELMLAVDFRVQGHPTADLHDVTKVLVKDGMISLIGKEIGTYNAFDTGVFLCTPGIFHALEESQKRGDFSLSGGIRVLIESRKARVMDIGDAFWIDVDDEKAIERAESLLALHA
jgi:1L-myo-inositol 1-phosphate cytidylyltransferase